MRNGVEQVVIIQLREGLRRRRDDSPDGEAAESESQTEANEGRPDEGEQDLWPYDHGTGRFGAPGDRHV